MAILLTGVLVSHHQLNAQSIKPRIQFDYFQRNNESHELSATVKIKVDRSYSTLEDVPVKFFIRNKGIDVPLGTASTNGKGKAILEVASQMLVTTDSTYTFIAAILDHDSLADTRNELDIVPASMHVEFQQEEEGKVIKATVYRTDSSGTRIPVSGVDVKVYVGRLFGELPVSVEFNTTDAAGTTKISFPDDIPGDENGNIPIVVKVQDHELFGNLIFTADVSWGTHLEANTFALRRELWSARMNAPLYLIIIVNAVLLGIWGTILYIILGLFRIRRLGKEPQVNSSSTENL